MKKTFYELLKPYNDLVDLLNSDDFAEVPDDWLIVVTDIVKSTDAIERGQYKEVNATNAAIISAVLNLNKNNYKSIPFAFGGDGAYLVIPKRIRQEALNQLAQAKLLANSFGLAIRCSIIPMKFIYDHGCSLKIGKLQISKKYSQAIFLGDGSEYAEKIMKSSQEFEVLDSEAMKNVTLQAHGFTCRWEPISSSRGKTLSVIVKSRGSDVLYSKILLEINKIFGHSEEFNPLNIENMNLTLQGKNINIEATIHSENWFSRIIDFVWIYIVNLLGRYPFLPQLQKNVQEKKVASVKHSDFIKIDGSLKLTISADEDQITRFRSYLDNLHGEEKLYYGLYINQASLITCLVFPSDDFEVHFVDGADGGYALAASEMKKQIVASLN